MNVVNKILQGFVRTGSLLLCGPPRKKESEKLPPDPVEQNWLDLEKNLEQPHARSFHEWADYHWERGESKIFTREKEPISIIKAAFAQDRQLILKAIFGDSDHYKTYGQSIVEARLILEMLCDIYIAPEDVLRTWIDVLGDALDISVFDKQFEERPWLKTILTNQ